MKRSSGRIAGRFAFLAAVGLTLAGLGIGRDGWAADSARGERTWNWVGDIAAGRTVEINGINGAIVVARAAGDRVEVLANITGRKTAADDVRIVATPTAEGVTICAIYPGCDSPCEHLAGSAGQRKTVSDVKVEFHVNVPAGVNLVANTVNGDVHARGLTGNLRVHTVNGECEIETAGSGEASTVNGSVFATIGHADASDTLVFKSVNGSVTLSLPAGLDADVEGSTVNGAIQSDFPSTASGQWHHFYTSATVGHGGAHLSASTVNGSVRLQRAGGR
jgi:hypothetical protein